MVISELKVMKNDNGIFYLGRTCRDEELQCNELPFSRQSGYFKCEQEAILALAMYPKNRRDCIENIDLYYQEDKMQDPKASFDMEFKYF